MDRASELLLSVEHLETHFRTERGLVKSVDDVSFHIGRGETLAVVGESGSGKSVTSLSIMGLIPDPPGRIVGGKILFRRPSGEAVDLARLPPKEMRGLRGKEIAMVFQEPMTSLDPVFTIGAQIAESVRLHLGLSRRAALDHALEMLELVEIPAARQRLDEYPHQLSGGMRQRVMIALALSCHPALLIADEPTTALDVTIQAQILELLQKLQQQLSMGILFITHNLGVVAEIANRVIVMYRGKVVEEANVRALFRAPKHPYTRGLLECLPRREQAAASMTGRARLKAIPGQVAAPWEDISGCAFSQRCAFREPRCDAAPPTLAEIEGDRRSRCYRWSEL